MRESGDLGIYPRLHAALRTTLGLSSFNLLRLNIVPVAKLLFVLDDVGWLSLISSFVMKGLAPLTQVHLSAEDLGGSHRGRIEKVKST